MADHAVAYRSPVVEVPLWLVWQAAYLLGCLSEWGLDRLDTYRNADPVSRRLAVVSAALTVVLLGLAVSLVILIFQY